MAEKYQKIVEDYKKTKNIRGTAKANQVSIVKVRRILITEGLWSSPTSEKVKTLWEQGLTAKEIADKLQIPLKNVQAYIPYSRGAYEESETTDSIRCKTYRERCKNTFQTQVLYDHKVFMDNSSPIELRRAHNKMQNSFSDAPERALRLRLDLIDSEVERHPEIGLYGKAEKNISRTVLIPATMNFNALHFLIQKVFGWKNRKTHHFGLTRDEFMWITNDHFHEYKLLSGVYFRFPPEKDKDKLDDKHWNDDYDGKESFSAWLKRKYCGPYYYLGYYDHFGENALAVRWFHMRHVYEELCMPIMYVGNQPIIGHVKFYTDTSTVNMVNKIMDFDQELNYLCERLPVRQIITVKDQITEDPRDIAKKAAFSNYACYHQTDKVAKDVVFRVAYMREQMKDPWDKTLNPEMVWDEYQDCVLRSTPDTKPVSDTVIYHYDYDNHWDVKVTCEEVYYEQENGKGFQDRNGNPVDAELKSYLTDYIMKEVPICLAKDGLAVLDDVDGIEGYCAFLRSYFDKENMDEREMCKRQARMYGWSPKDVNLCQMI